MTGSGVQFKGLTQFVDVMRRAKTRWPNEANDLTKKVGKDILSFYQGNLAGSSPSTSAQPLPVGQITGDLYEGAEIQQVNQYATRVVNKDGKAAWMEFGTVHITPRRPLADALEQYTGGDFPNDANKVLPKVFK